jgi:hypothetical protein
MKANELMQDILIGIVNTNSSARTIIVPRDNDLIS